MAMTPKEAVKFAKDHGTRMVHLKFMDFPGTWQHFTVPVSAFDEATFEEGVGFDGSSIRGWQAIHTSDMLVVPDPATAVLDPFTEVPTLSLICNIVDPITRERYTRDPRTIAQKQDVIDTWLWYKRTKEVDAVRLRPHPYEFVLYYDL